MLMNTMRSRPVHWLSILFLVLLTLCRSAREGNQDSTPAIPDQGNGPDITQVKNIYYTIPSPAEMMEVMQEEEMNFHGKLLNPVASIEYYGQVKSGSMNLGVYLTDLAYCSVFGRHEAAVDYLKAVEKLAGRLRIQGALSESMIKRAMDHIGDPDSLFEISNEAFVNMVMLCEETGRSNTLVMITCGAMVESLYLATSHVEYADDAEHLFRHLADQKYMLDNFWAFANSLSGDPYMAGVINDLKPLEELYGKLGNSPGQTTMKRKDDGTLVIGGSAQPALSVEEFDNLKETVNNIRTGIVTVNK
jgi:hypothetical protein